MRISDWSSDVCSSDLFRKRRRQNEQKRRPSRERTPGRDPGEKQDDHAAMHMQQTVRGARAHAERGAQWAVKIDEPFHDRALSTRANEPVDRKSTRLNSSH